MKEGVSGALSEEPVEAAREVVVDVVVDVAEGVEEDGGTGEDGALTIAVFAVLGPPTPLEGLAACADAEVVAVFDPDAVGELTGLGEVTAGVGLF